MADALVVIDIQNEYFPGGANPLPDSAGATERAAEAIGAARAAGVPVIHIRHEELESEEWGFVPGTPAAETHASVAPGPGEAVIVKHHANALLETDLAEQLDAAGASRVAFCGMMTSMCVDATVRAAADHGIDALLIADACAAPDLAHGGRTVPAAAVHAAFCAALGDGIATLTDAAAFAAGPAES
ncbi:MAG TPA: cysteine hydrolase family protein [Gaiellaceae bacterium]|nr:cysteine hydrolase family protein [Gaiellaceae bacterium]